ncbi:CcmD family protein [Deminuibacter soli]|uniref:CcmD family protein n=1 Tax=Deminuibacter soli TaxID=2291815 RepID=A0A3E1NL58_9BACT|nr:CcmD family protein [Deminuibacter soli]RFM28666.1 CcmD family protein [Deminuibacter soli]
MDKLKRIGFVIAFSLLQVFAFAQEMNTTKEDPTDFMRSNGKLYVVVAVIVTIVAGLFIYLLNLDRKISRLEKDMKQKA